ncbi:MAG: creatininase family protein [Bacillus sp. (in: firmicutes)]
MSLYDLNEMTWEEVGEALKTVQLAIIPVGAHEQHGPHMVESCDAVLASEMAKRLSEKLYPYVIKTPTVNFGVSQHHSNFPGTITLQPTTLLAILRDMVVSLKRHGITQFLFLNAHGGNQSTLNVASTTLSAELHVKIYYAKTTASAKNAISTGIHSTLFGHSCEREVSEALFLAPQLIRTDRIAKGEINTGGKWELLRPGKAIQGFYPYEEMTENGCIGDARMASKELGERIVKEALGNLADDLCRLLQIERVIN